MIVAFNCKHVLYDAWTSAIATGSKFRSNPSCCEGGLDGLEFHARFHSDPIFVALVVVANV